MYAKQVLVMKKFPKILNVPVGKYISQGSHASVGALLSIAEHRTVDGNEYIMIPLADPFISAWCKERFTKITVRVDTDDELIKIYKDAVQLGLPCTIINDSGLTIFGGTSTLTAVGIGPADPDLIDRITLRLPLF
jgi:PTH2 family peptidyl-tRNA hydrolase